MASEIGNAAAAEARGVPGFDLLGSGVIRENNSASARAQASASSHVQQPAVPRATRQLEILALRSLQLADRVAAGQLGFLEAVHLAYDGSIWAGLPAAIDKSGLIGGTICGDDIVQATIAAAFANARRPE